MDPGKISENKPANYGHGPGSLYPQKTSWLTMDPGKISENKPANYAPRQNIRKQAG